MTTRNQGLPGGSGQASTTAAHAGLYIHVPFCIKKCAYCDFYSITDLSRTGAFRDAVLREMALFKGSPLVFDTIYIGGGTPSVLPPDDIGRMITRAGELFDIRDGAEITMEVNPGTVDPANLLAYRQAGVNRINIGVQSFSPVNLDFLGRLHTAEEARAAIVAARRAGFENLGMDLIYGIPGQSVKDWQNDLEQAVGFAPEHLSCYILTYEQGTPLGQLTAGGHVHPLVDAAVADQFERMQLFLEKHGYEQYEIANFARHRREENASGTRGSLRSRHNWKYWTGAPYLGLGPSAHSFTPPERRWNVADLQTYLLRLNEGRTPVDGREILTDEQRLTETLYLELRTREGIDIHQLERSFGLNFGERFGTVLDGLAEEGLVAFTGARCFLTRKGMRFLDGIAELLVDR